MAILQVLGTYKVEDALTPPPCYLWREKCVTLGTGGVSKEEQAAGKPLPRVFLSP